MAKNCDSSCDSSTSMCHNLRKSPEPNFHIFLRNNVYYVRYEVEAVNEKRKFIRFSLHTKNYYEARQMIQDMRQYMQKVRQLDECYKKLRLEKHYITNGGVTVFDSYILSKDNDIELLKRVKSLYDDCFLEDIDDELEDYKLNTQAQLISNRNKVEKIMWFSPSTLEEHRVWPQCLRNATYVKNVLAKVGQIIIEIQNVLSPQEPALSHESPKTSLIQNKQLLETDQTDAPRHTIQEIIDHMCILLSDRVGANGLKRKRQDIEKILSKLGISTDEDYSKLNSPKVINQIYDVIIKIPNVAPKTHNRMILCINSLTASAHKLEPDYFKEFNLTLRRETSQTASSQEKAYEPFSNNELIKIFNPKEKFFIKYPDIFYSCLIAMYCGGRTNGITTLRYTDIVEEHDIKCFKFQPEDKDENPNIADIKRLKTKATARTVPIHSKLIELGFLKYIDRHKINNKKYCEGFIFSRVLTGNKTYNGHFFRPFFLYLEEIGIRTDKGKNKRWKSFHSFRNTISNALDDAGVSDLMALKIVGWKGNSVRAKHYSKRELTAIQQALEKLNYSFLDESLIQISEQIMADK